MIDTAPGLAPLRSETLPRPQRFRRGTVPVRARPRPRSVDAAVWQLAGVSTALGLVEIALLLTGPPFAPRWILLLWPVAAAVALTAGVVAWLRRPSNRMGSLMIWSALIWLGAGLANVSVAPALLAAGLIAATLPLAMVVHLLHAFPSGRVRGRLSALAVAGAYATCLVLQAPQYLWGPDNPLQLSDRPDRALDGIHVQWVVGSALMVVTIVVLFRRWRRASPPRRRVLAPLYLYGIFAALFIPVSAQVTKQVFPEEILTMIVAQVIVVGAVPVAFALAMLRGGFAKTVELEELGAWLGTDAATRPDLRVVFADALGDDSVELVFWVADGGGGGYADRDGRRVALPEPSGDRAFAEVRLGERRVGAILYDGSLIADSGVVVAAGRVIALALDHERLLVELRASREVLRASRARIVEAADSERRRIARDLHDGLQAHLVLLAIEADDPALEAGLQAAITELRHLVHGVMPAALTERGLYAAASELADRVPFPTVVHVNADAGALPGPVESTGYFVVSEALSNAVKHSRANELVVALEQDAGRLRIEVRDDGVGGARCGAGHGLRGIADRVDALDGSLTIDSPPGGGTRVVAEVPCSA